MQVMSQSHAAEDVLEQYAMDKLSEAEDVRLEEHLLVCSECRQRLEFLDEFVRSIRSAARSTSQAAGAGRQTDS
jgi:predicted anti-sigma-YlaC factor YlaD